MPIYDMCKGIEKGIAITETCLTFKEGGKSGVYRNPCAPIRRALRGPRATGK